MKVLSVVEMEMLKTLSCLRYLSGDQIHRSFYKERSSSGCISRISRLAKANVLERSNLRGTRWRSAYRLGHEGFVSLGEALSREVPKYRDLSVHHLPHLLSTNEVFLCFARDAPTMGRLSFSWMGSHRAILPYEDSRRSRRIRPDAIVTPKPGVSGKRVFVELDRSTERVRARDGQRSIENKLKAYRRFLEEGPIGYPRHLVPEGIRRPAKAADSLRS